MSEQEHGVGMAQEVEGMVMGVDHSIGRHLIGPGRQMPIEPPTTARKAAALFGLFAELGILDDDPADLTPDVARSRVPGGDGEVGL